MVSTIPEDTLRRNHLRSTLHSFGDVAGIYNRIQQSVGANRVWDGLNKHLSSTFETWGPNDLWLDMGCGTSTFLHHVPLQIRYLGIDQNPNYIKHATQTFAHRSDCQFIEADWSKLHWQHSLEGYNVRLITALGLLHHLPDLAVQQLLSQANRLLGENGHIVTLDGCREADSSKSERFFYWIDRGRYIRSKNALVALFPQPPQTIIHQSWLRVPYRYLICTLPKTSLLAETKP